MDIISLVIAVVALGLLAAILWELIGIHREAERQTDLWHRIGRAAGWLPQDRKK